MIDYEADPRPLADVLKAWRPNASRAEKAAALGVAVETYHGWCKGRPCSLETSIRRLMTLLDQKNGGDHADDLL